jgi:hypothetical protein
LKKAETRIRNLKREQNKLKNTISKEFMDFKNLFLQLEDQLLKSKEEAAKLEGLASNKTSRELDSEFIYEIGKEALAIERYFA